VAALMFFIGIILNGTLALVPTMLQELMNYPVLTTGLVTAPRGIGTMIAMFLVVHLIGRVDMRLIILTGLGLTAVSLWQMTGFSLQMGMGPVISTGVLQGFGLGFIFTPLSTVTFSTLPRQNSARYRGDQATDQGERGESHRSSRPAHRKPVVSF
jgi:DHA2 family multidrug resistance protein